MKCREMWHKMANNQSKMTYLKRICVNMEVVHAPNIDFSLIESANIF